MSEVKKKFVCRHCKVEVVSKEKPVPVLGKQHKKSCPRRRNLG